MPLFPDRLGRRNEYLSSQTYCVSPMNFSGEILIRIDGDTAETCWLGEVGESLRIPIQNTNDPVDRIQRTINNWVQEVGTHYVDHWSNTEDYVTCPEGDVLLPIDRWHCKITGELCPIQARVPLQSKENFIDGCNIETASEEYEKDPDGYKEGIWQAVNNEKYLGGHHKVGRRPCVFCSEKERQHYLHFPWEMTELYTHFEDYEEARISRDLVIEDLAYKIGHNICTPCFLGLDETYSNVDLSEYGLDLEQYQGAEYSFSY